MIFYLDIIYKSKAYLAEKFVVNIYKQPAATHYLYTIDMHLQVITAVTYILINH